MENLITLTIRNHNERRKGEFNITDIGIMSPKTRNSSIWGSIDANVVPRELFFNSNFVIPFSGKTKQDGLPLRLSAFFKFQRSKFNTFAENAGMELATFFNCKTSYNCPSKLNKEEISIREALQVIPEKDNLEIPGSLVVSMLDQDEKLFSFAWLMKKEESSSDIRYTLRAIDSFINQNYKDLTSEERLEKANALKEEFCYQYLFRDCFGDVDFTSRNSGIIYNTETKETSIAAMFDYGEMFNVLYSSKIAELKLNDIDSFPDYLKNVPGFIEKLEGANAIKLEKRNSSPYELGSIRTFGEESLKNLGTICEHFPNTAFSFLQTLDKFNQSNIIGLVVKDASGTFGKPLLSEEEENMVTEFAQGRIDSFSLDLIDSLKMNADKNFLIQNPIAYNLEKDYFQQ